MQRYPMQRALHAMAAHVHACTSGRVTMPSLATWHVAPRPSYGTRHARSCRASAGGRPMPPEAYDDEQRGVQQMMPADVEGTNPRWRWPGFQGSRQGQPSPPPPPPPPPPPATESFRSSPFSFWDARRSTPRQPPGPQPNQARRPQQDVWEDDPWSQPRQNTSTQQSRRQERAPKRAWWQPQMQGFAQRVFRNPEIQKLAQAEYESRQEDINTATASRNARGGSWDGQQGQGRRTGGGFVPPPDIDGEEFADWIEWKRQRREKQREQNQVSMAVGLDVLQCVPRWGRCGDTLTVFTCRYRRRMRSGALQSCTWRLRCSSFLQAS